MSDRDFQFNNLRPEKILATITQLAKRIRERFPESSLAVLGEELRGVALEASDRADRIRKPIIALRVASGLLVALIVIGVFGTVLTLDNKDASLSLAEFIQLLEAGINDIVLIGAGIFFLFTLETRIKRNRALDAIHELRSLAHIIDMHQLTKDMTRMEHTQSSPLRPMTPAQLERYLDYCSEMLSLVGKIAALYIQHFNETVAIAAVTEVENLTTGLSRKIWQKITLIENHDERMRVQKYRNSSEDDAKSEEAQLDRAPQSSNERQSAEERQKESTINKTDGVSNKSEPKKGKAKAVTDKVASKPEAAHPTQKEETRLDKTKAETNKPETDTNKPEIDTNKPKTAELMEKVAKEKNLQPETETETPKIAATEPTP